MKILLLIVASLFIVNSAQARDCFRQSRINGFSAVDRNTVILKSFRQDYKLELSMCLELRWADRISFRSWSGSRFNICENDDLLVLDNFGSRVVERCRIRKITKVLRKQAN